MARITHPRPKAGSQKQFDIVFHDGFADVDELHPIVEAALLQHGFTIEDVLTVDSDAQSPFEPLPPSDSTEKVSKPRKPKTLDNFNTTPFPQPPALVED
jgi:hypothetical protein